MSSHSISASMIYKKDVQNEFVESRREQTRLQEELLRKEKALRDTQIRSMREMGRMKRAQVQQVDEFSVQKLRESHETIQQLTSQLQQMQEQMNFYERFWRFSGCRIKEKCKIISRSQSTCKNSEFSVVAQPR